MRALINLSAGTTVGWALHQGKCKIEIWIAAFKLVKHKLRAHGNPESGQIDHLVMQPCPLSKFLYSRIIFRKIRKDRLGSFQIIRITGVEKRFWCRVVLTLVDVKFRILPLFRGNLIFHWLAIWQLWGLVGPSVVDSIFKSIKHLAA